MIDSVENFLNNYYFFVHHITSNKKQLESLETIYIVIEAVKSLIELINENRVDEIDSSTINNLIHFSKVYLNSITIPPKLTSKKKVIMKLEKKINELDNLLLISKKLSKR